MGFALLFGSFRRDFERRPTCPKVGIFPERTSYERHDSMYPVNRGYLEAETRMNNLIQGGHHAEALLASVFAFEKTVRRTLRFCALNRGLTSKQCDKLFKNSGLEAMKEVWPIFEKQNRALPDFIGQKIWQPVPEAVKMRNKMVHGVRVFSLNDCKEKAELVITALETLRNRSISELSCDPWSRLPGKKASCLPWLNLSNRSSSGGNRMKNDK